MNGYSAGASENGSRQYMADKMLRRNGYLCMAINSFYMKLQNLLAPFPSPIDYASMVKQYKLKFQQHHLEALSGDTHGKQVQLEQAQQE